MNLSRLNSPLVMWVLVLAGVWLSWATIPAGFIWQRHIIDWFLFGVVFLYGLVMWISSLRVHRKAVMSTSSITEIVTTGPYAFVRHPIYSADIAVAIGAIFLVPSPRGIVAACWAIAMFQLWMHFEEQGLLAKFGDQYRAYRTRVPRYVPWMRRHPTA